MAILSDFDRRSVAALLALAVAAFCHVTVETVPVGLLSEIAAEPYGTAGRESQQAVRAAQLFELDGKAVALLQGDLGLTLYDLATGEPIGEAFATHTGGTALTSTATGVIDGHPVVVTGTNAGEVQVWSL